MSLVEKLEALDQARSAASDARLCFASFERGTVIDLAQNGRGIYGGKTLEECRAEYPDAAEMTLEAFCEWKGAQQDAPVEWEPTTEDRYHEMLEVLPPIVWNRAGFLVGEACDHHARTGEPRYQAFTKLGNAFRCSNRPITVREWRALTA